MNAALGIKQRASKGSEYKDDKLSPFEDQSVDEDDDDFDPKINRASTDNSGVEMSDIRKRNKKGQEPTDD